MELKQAHKYVERFFDGKTSLAEEQALLAYFLQPKVDKTLMHYKAYFNAIAKQREQRFPGNFTPVRKTKIVQLKRLSVVAAAAIAGVFLLQQIAITSQPTPEEIAFEKFKLNMYLVSEQLNKSKQGVTYIETFNTATNKYLKKE